MSELEQFISASKLDLLVLYGITALSMFRTSTEIFEDHSGFTMRLFGFAVALAGIIWASKFIFTAAYLIATFINGISLNA